ncbi:MAG: hypothetical protein IT323_02960 [Anaerolineae bacterium]|nr:hypothetical protein [Anaerolineae bacterium]
MYAYRAVSVRLANQVKAVLICPTRRALPEIEREKRMQQIVVWQIMGGIGGVSATAPGAVCMVTFFVRQA